MMALGIALLCSLLMVGGGVWAVPSDDYATNWNVIGVGGEPASSVELTINPSTDEDNPPVATGLDSISDWLVVVYGFDNATKTWTWYNPSWPPGANTLDALYMGSGYWTNVGDSCTLTYETSTYELYTGWNLIG